MLRGQPLNILVKNLARGGVAAAGAFKEGFLGGSGGADDAPAAGAGPEEGPEESAM